MKGADVVDVLVVIGFLIAFVLVGSFGAQLLLARPVPNIVIKSASYSGSGGVWDTITLRYGNNQTYTTLVSCNFYTVGSTEYPLMYYPQVLFLPAYYGDGGSSNLQLGC